MLTVTFVVDIVVSSVVSVYSRLISQLINYTFFVRTENIQLEKIPDEVSAAAAALSAPQWRYNASPRLRRIISLTECSHKHVIHVGTVIQFARYVTIIMIGTKLNIFFFFVKTCLLILSYTPIITSDINAPNNKSKHIK